MGKNVISRSQFLSGINNIFLLMVLGAVSGILTISLALQIYFHEIPCPLCLLQRLSFFGIAYGAISAFRQGCSIKYIGCMSLFALYLVVVGGRQSLINIVARAGHAWVGGTIFGFHLPVWSVIIGLLFLVLISLYLILIPQKNVVDNKNHVASNLLILRIGSVLSEYVIFLCVINLVLIIFQCGFGVCHTSKYFFWHN